MVAGSRRVKVLVAAALAGYVIVVLAAFLGPPTVQWALAVISFAALGGFLFRTRSGYGRGRGLPPGSLALISQMDQVDDRYFLQMAERHGAVFKTTQAWRPTVCVVGMDRIAALLSQHDNRLTRGEMLFSTLIPQGFLRFMSREAHERYRPVLAKAVALAGDTRNWPGLSAAIARELAATKDDEISPGDLVPAIVQRLFIRAFFGVPAESPRMARFETLYATLDCRRLSGDRLEAGRAALGEMAALVREGLARDDAPSCALATLVAEDPALLDDETVVANLVALVQVGSYDLASLLVWIWKILSDHPDWPARLRDELEHGEGGLADRIITETLRLEQSEYLKRTALEDLSFEGFQIPRGWNVQMCLRESHQNPEAFPAPRDFNPDRFADDPLPSRGYAPFGMGRRRCPAQRLTYLIGNCFLRELVSNYSWQVVRDGPRVHDGIHWTPSRNFRIALSRRSEKN